MNNIYKLIISIRYNIIYNKIENINKLKNNI